MHCLPRLGLRTETRCSDWAKSQHPASCYNHLMRVTDHCFTFPYRTCSSRFHSFQSHLTNWQAPGSPQYQCDFFAAECQRVTKVAKCCRSACCYPASADSKMLLTCCCADYGLSCDSDCCLGWLPSNFVDRRHHFHQVRYYRSRPYSQFKFDYLLTIII